jgi:hypothetical protein
MSRVTSFLACSIIGLSMLACGLLIPAHLRSVDARIIELAGRNSPGTVSQGLEMAIQKNLGSAQWFLEAGLQEKIPGQEPLRSAVEALAQSDHGLATWGSPEVPALVPALGSSSVPPESHPAPEPVTGLLIREEIRKPVLEMLRASSQPEIQELLQFRALTNTVLFPPSSSASGQALDTAICICGLVLESDQSARSATLPAGIAPEFRSSIAGLARQANAGGNPQYFEQVLMDLLSLGQRFNWGQLSAFLIGVRDAQTLHELTENARKADRQLPVLFTATQVSGNPAGVSKYLMTFSQTGLRDLGASLRFGSGGVNELLRLRHRLDQASGLPVLGVGLVWRMPWIALGLKWLLYVSAGFLLALAFHYARRPVPELEEPLEVRGFHIAREVLFALGFLLVVLLLSEPFLAQDTQKVDFPFRLHLPTIGSHVAAGIPSAHSSIMNQLSILALLLFFVLQGLLYIASVFKLAEIRRQRMPSRMKLKLLENEDHLFDAGLYLGFVGTIISLILVSLGVIKPSLMAAYSSTSFGIIFVSIFKIFHLRPARRRLLIEAEAGAKEGNPATGPQALAVHL